MNESDIPSTQEIAEQLKVIEARAHRRGWDREPSLWALYQPPGEAPQADILIADWSKFDLPRHGGERILAMAEHLAYMSRGPIGRAAVRTLANKTPGLYGLAYSVEAYGRVGDTHMDEDEYRQFATGQHRPLADDVKAKELRVVGAYDRNMNHYMLIRVRGREPDECFVTTPESRKADRSTSTGRVPDALAMLLAVLTEESVAAHLTSTTLPAWLVAPREAERP